MTLTLLRNEEPKEAEAYMRSHLRSVGGNVSLAARLLNIHRVYFYWILRRMGLSKLPQQIRDEAANKFKLPPVSRFR